MSTVDIVNQVGGQPANFLDIGGGANAEVMAGALEVINNDPNVQAIFINIFGGITKGEEVANGIVEALGRVDIGAPIVIRLDGTNADEGRAILGRPRVRPAQLQADDARGRRGRRRAGREVGSADMAIFVDENTKVVYQGLTGSQGRFYGLRNRDYGTQVVAGTNPKKAGTDVDGIPIFAIGRPTPWRPPAPPCSCIFIPAPGVRGRGAGGGRGRHRARRRDHRGRARPGRGVVLQQAEAGLPRHPLLGPNCPGIISPGKANIGITAGEIAKPGGPVGIVSRSGTLTYQALYELKQQGIGVTTCVGIGGDPVPGTSFIDCLEAFEADPDTKAVMMIGEIGGSAEEEAAEFIKTKMTKPVVVLHRRRHRAAGQEDGPRRRHRLGRQGHGRGQDGGPRATPASRSARTRPRPASSWSRSSRASDRLTPVSASLDPAAGVTDAETCRTGRGLAVGCERCGSGSWSPDGHDPRGDAGRGLPIVAGDRRPSCGALERADEGGSRPVELVERTSFGPDFDRLAYTDRVVDALRSATSTSSPWPASAPILDKPIHDAYGGRILNTHPALLPAFPGWHAVDDALAYGVKVTGCTVHVRRRSRSTPGRSSPRRRCRSATTTPTTTLHERIKDVERRLYPDTHPLRSCERGSVL